MTLNGLMDATLHSVKFSSYGANYIKLVEDMPVICDNNIVQRI